MESGNGPAREAASLSSLQATLGHTFRDVQVLLRALTHSSLAYEQMTEAGIAPGGIREEDNEQLEFLGDAVLGFVVAALLYRSFPDLREGELTRMRASLVNRQHMAHIGRAVDLGRHLRLGRGEERSGGRKKAALLANAMEAVIAALYLDGGLTPVQEFIAAHVVAPYARELRHAIDVGAAIGDYKSALQELLQAQKGGTPEYLVTAESGPDHRKRFLVEVRVRRADDEGRVVARGAGPTKKAAEQQAARRAYERMRDLQDGDAAEENDGGELQALFATPEETEY